MKRNLFQLLTIFLLINIIFTNANSKKDKNTNNKSSDTKSKSKELDISEDFSAEIFYRLGIKKLKNYIYKLTLKNIFK